MSAFRRFIRQILPIRVRQYGWQGYHGPVNRIKWYASSQMVAEIETQEKLIALTFDDGPDPDATPQVLQVLEQFEAKGTFFLLGNKVLRHPEIVQELLHSGHAIGNHTWSHRQLSGISPVEVAQEIRKCQVTMREVLGTAPAIMRPPFGSIDLVAYLTVRSLGYEPIGWSILGLDYVGDTAGAIADRVLANARPGAIVLLHDGLEPPAGQREWTGDQQTLLDRTPMIEALRLIVAPLREQGYRFVTVPEILGMGRIVRRRWDS